MIGGKLRQRVLDATEATSVGQAAARYAAYLALRLWVVAIGCFPIETNLRTARLMGSLWWHLADVPWPRWKALRTLRRFRRRRAIALRHLRRSFGNQYNKRALRRIARASYRHFAQLYLVELVMTPRLITPWSWAQHVELGDLAPGLRLLIQSRGVIMLTGHFGNYELLGYTICRLGMPLTAVMRPVDNPLINNYLVASRQAGGLLLLYKKGATTAAPEVIEGGGALCFIADQDAGRKGMFVDFFGRPASTYKSIGLLAMQKRVPIVVGYAVRTRRGFHYRLAVERIIQPEEWDAQGDPLRWITQTYTHALEAAIRRWPEQYLWAHRRWKHRPKEERAARRTTA